MINCRPNDTKVPIEQEFAIVVKDVPSLFDHICVLGDFSVKIILKHSQVGSLQVLGGRMRLSGNKFAVLLDRDLLQRFLIVVFFRGLGRAYVVFSLESVRLRHELFVLLVDDGFFFVGIDIFLVKLFFAFEGSFATFREVFLEFFARRVELALVNFEAVGLFTGLMRHPPTGTLASHTGMRLVLFVYKHLIHPLYFYF